VTDLLPPSDHLDGSRLLRIAEVADHLALSESRIYELVNAGLLPSVKIGKSRRVSLGAIRSFVGHLEAGDEQGTATDGRPIIWQQQMGS
jgi:excisionase family DNA binding protein